MSSYHRSILPYKSYRRITYSNLISTLIYSKMRDLSKHTGTLTNALEPLIGRMNSLDVSQVRDQFLDILVDENVKISTATRSKWINAINRCKTKDQRMRAISNAYLAGSGLGVNV